MNIMVSLSNTPMAHPPRSNPFLRSSSDAPPFPCITPSTVTCVMVVSFMGSSFLSWWSLVFLVRPHRGADLIGRAQNSRRPVSGDARQARGNPRREQALSDVALQEAEVSLLEGHRVGASLPNAVVGH